MSGAAEVHKPDSDELNLNGDEIPGLKPGQNPDAEDGGEESDEYDDFEEDDKEDEDNGGGDEEDEEDDEAADKGNLTALLLNDQGVDEDDGEDDEDADLYRGDEDAPAKNLKRNIEEVEDDEDKEAKKVKA